MAKSIFEFKFYDTKLVFKYNDFITILGNDNDLIVNNISYTNEYIISYNTLLKFDKIKTVDFVGKYVKKIKKLNNYLKDFNLFECRNNYIDEMSLGDRLKLSILTAFLSKSNVIIINNLLSILDDNDYKLIIKLLKDYNKNSIIINLTNNTNEALFGNKIAIIYNKKLLCFGGTLSVLNEEKIFKRLGLGLPFIIELNKYLMDYGLIDKYYLSNKKLVGALWK